MIIIFSILEAVNELAYQRNYNDRIFNCDIFELQVIVQMLYKDLLIALIIQMMILIYIPDRYQSEEVVWE